MSHVHEKIDFTTQAFVVYKDKVLLRFHEKYHVWLAVGGHIELDEDPNQAVLREVKEEVGLDVELYDNREFKGNDLKKELIAPISINRHRINDTHEHVDFIYFAKSNSDAVVPEKLTDVWKWCTRADLDQTEMDSHVAFFARKALQVLGAP